MLHAPSKSTRKARILVVDDHPLFRSGLVQLINRQEDLACQGEADSVSTAKELVRKFKPDLLALDLRLGHSDGLELIRFFKSHYPDLRILVLSQHDEVLYAERVLRAGAHGYLMKEEATEEVLAAIRTVLRGELYVSRKISVLVLRKSLRITSQAGDTGVESLSDRELQVFQMLGAGLGTKYIAEQLKLSAKTIETYREKIKQKLGLSDATQLISYATAWVRGDPPSSAGE
jgi:DNA-binding NarL/FixJ family response regulator